MLLSVASCKRCVTCSEKGNTLPNSSKFCSYNKEEVENFEKAFIQNHPQGIDTYPECK